MAMTFGLPKASPLLNVERESTLVAVVTPMRRHAKADAKR
jgi:hypothetical protein